MDAYVSKPINGQEVIALVERLAVTHHPTQGQGPSPSGHSTQQRPESPVAEKPPEPQTSEAAEAAVFDLNDAVKKCFGSYKTLQEMVECFFDEADRLTGQMRAATAQGDPEEAYRAAHRLKNTVAYLGAAPATEATRNVERLAKLGELAVANDAIEELERQVSRLKPALTPHRRKALLS
jgi:HPt (histidine-containing phosphotransfer) domain-containing protein